MMRLFMRRYCFITAVLVTGVALVGSFSSSNGGYSGKLESINFGTVPTAATTLIYIVEDQHFFAAHGLRVNIKDHNTGTATTEALLKGDMNISWVAEFPKEEAQWMIKNNLTTEKSIPDFVNYIYVDGLKAVKPEAVNIVR
jgi:ABC-type nitrate/sulfonate/bicarbonate transport system substrate-binding protein